MLNVDLIPLEEYKGARVHIKCKCKICGHEWMITPERIYSGQGCPICGRKKCDSARAKTNEEFVKRLSEKNPNIIALEPYIKASVKIKFKCLVCGNIWETTPDNILHRGVCPKCSLERRTKARTKTHSEFEKEMSEINPGIILLGEYTGAKNKIKCKCIKHDHIFESPPTHLLQGKVGCHFCRSEKISNAFIKKHDVYLEDLKKVNDDVEVLGEYKGSHNRIKVRCKKCGYVWEPQASSLLCGFGCPKCSPLSKGENKISEILDSLGIEYNMHVRFDGLVGVRGGKLSYDFYIPKYNLLIEFQGSYHDNTSPKQTQEQFEVQKEHDRLKAEYAKRNNYNFLEIWYYDFKNIEKILMECFNDLESPVTTTAV